MKNLTQLFAIFMILAAQSNAQPNKKGIKIIENKKDSGSLYAVVIGVSDYKHLPKLQFADADAIAFYNYLRGIIPQKDSNNISLLLNSEATRDNVSTYLNDIVKYKIKAGDKLVFYFSGHGDMEQEIYPDNSLLLLGDCERQDYTKISSHFLDIASLSGYFLPLIAKNATLVFVCDACHSGSLKGGIEGKNNNLAGLKKAYEKQIKLLSCQSNEVSIEGENWGGGRGLFSYYLLLGLKGLADEDRSNSVTLFELQSYLQTNVRKASKGAQTPQVFSDDVNFVLGKVTLQTIADAKKEAAKNISDFDITLKGKSSDFFDLLNDSTSKIIYSSFTECLKTGRLIYPVENCAEYYYRQFEKGGFNDFVLNKMKGRMISALQFPFYEMLEYVYSNTYANLDFESKINIKRMLDLAVELTNDNKELQNRINSKLLFYHACEITKDIAPNSFSQENNELLDEGIRFLNEAQKLDSISPHIYLKLGDFILYNGFYRDKTKAINSYLKYQRLLPNDFQSYNKLGLGYRAIGKYDLALEAFTKALKLRPDSEDAKQNLRVIRELKAKM